MGSFRFIHFFGIAAALMVIGLSRPDRADVLLSTDFETDPTLQGWTTNGFGASWTTNASFSGTHSIACSNGVAWLSPLLNTTPLQWYRLTFKSLAPGAVSNPGSIGYAYWAAQFFDTNGNLLSEDQYSSVFQSSGWVTNEFRIRAKNNAGPYASLVPVQMQLRFQSISPTVYLDDVTLQTTTPSEVAHWGDGYYDMLPAKLAYVPKRDRWSRIPLTLNKLRAGQSLRIVMLGDSVVQDTANAPWDAWLERLYPGANIQVISSTRGGTGVQYYYTNMPQYVFAYQPDLLCLGGISQDDTLSYFQSIVDQLRANDSANGRTTEILFLTKDWSPNVEQSAYFLDPTMAELDQVSSNNSGGISNDYRGVLLGFCETNGLEYLDMTGIDSEFIYGAANAAGVGPPANSNGDPYSYWLRDFVHSSDHGKMIQGRILEAFFAPPPQLSISQQAGVTSLAWPLASTGYFLETATALSTNGTVWASNATVFTVTNGQNVFTTNLASVTNALFFRLHRN